MFDPSQPGLFTDRFHPALDRYFSCIQNRCFQHLHELICRRGDTDHRCILLHLRQGCRNYRQARRQIFLKFDRVHILRQAIHFKWENGRRKSFGIAGKRTVLALADKMHVRQFPESGTIHICLADKNERPFGMSFCYVLQQLKIDPFMNQPPESNHRPWKILQFRGHLRSVTSDAGKMLAVNTVWNQIGVWMEMQFALIERLGRRDDEIALGNHAVFQVPHPSVEIREGRPFVHTVIDDLIRFQMTNQWRRRGQKRPQLKMVHAEFPRMRTHVPADQQLVQSLTAGQSMKRNHERRQHTHIRTDRHRTLAELPYFSHNTVDIVHRCRGPPQPD